MLDGNIFHPNSSRDMRKAKKRCIGFYLEKKLTRKADNKISNLSYRLINLSYKLLSPAATG